MIVYNLTSANSNFLDDIALLQYIQTISVHLLPCLNFVAEDISIQRQKTL